MKRYIRSSFDKPYLYIFKHGIGPGTLPKDVQIVRTKDLPRGYTAVWLDRFLTTPEMDEFDIPYETEINRYLDRIGYCQKHGDVVPCDDVEACGDIKASRTIDRWDHNTEKYEPVEIPDDWNVTTFSSDLDEEVNCVHCGKPIPYGDSYCSRRYHDKYGMGYAECEDCYEEQLRDEFGNKDVEACDNITASDICYRDRDNDDSVVALDAGMSDEDVEQMLAEHPSYYRSTLDRFEACDDITASTNGSQGDFTVIQGIYEDFNEPDGLSPVCTQEYDVNLDEVLAKYPQVANRALKDWSDETFKAGDMITNTLFARYVEYIAQGEGESDQLYSDFKDYVAQHPELPDPYREIEVRINNPQCLPSAEEIRRRHSEEMGKYLGEKLGLRR